MTSRHATVPPGQLTEVIRTLYATAERLGWEHLPPQERSTQYARWVADPAVGGVLTRYMTSEQTRSWIKDGPMKEFARARRGTGRYAQYGQPSGTGPPNLVQAALGEGWTVVDGSLGDKPSHCRARRDDETAYVTWGTAPNFRHLVWAALRAAVETDAPAAIVVTETTERPTPEADAAWQRRIAGRCGLRITHLRERLAPAFAHPEAP
jgi:hypothetical protein